MSRRENMICFIVEVILNARHVLIKMLNQSIRDPTSKNDHEEHQEDEQDDDFILLKGLHEYRITNGSKLYPSYSSIQRIPWTTLSQAVDKN